MKAVAGRRRAIELAIGEEELATLRTITRSRTEPASWVERAQMLLAYREDPSFFAVGRTMGVHHQTVQRCVERASACGPLAALDDLAAACRPSPACTRPSRAIAPRHGQFAGRHRPAHRPGSRSRQGPHRSREFIEFLQLLDAAYPAHTAIKLILDNHSAHISKETKAWLASQPAGRFEFVFTPKHGSWLNLVEGIFSKLARYGAAPHPRRIQAGTQGPHHGCHGSIQSRSRRSHLVLQA